MDNVSRGAGSFNAITENVIDGWMESTPEAPIDSFALYVDGVRIRNVAAVPRDGRPTFTFHAHGAKLRRFARVEVLGCTNRQPVLRITSRYRDDVDDVSGLACAGELLDLFARHRPLDSLQRVLAYGSASVTVHIVDMLASRPWVSVETHDGQPPLPWPDETFDAIFAASFQEAWRSEMMRVIEPGGMLVAEDFVIRRVGSDPSALGSDPS